MALDITQVPSQAPNDKPEDDSVKPDEVSGGKTPEEIEAYWRNRVSKKDTAHAAAEKALREELETLRVAQQAAPTASPGQNGQQGTEAEQALRRQIEQQAEELKKVQAARVIDQRKAKYPILAAQGLEDAVFATASEASLAKLNALATDDPGGTTMAPTSPRRSAPTAPKPYSEKTKDELLADLREATKGMTGV